MNEATVNCNQGMHHTFFRKDLKNRGPVTWFQKRFRFVDSGCLESKKMKQMPFFVWSCRVSLSSFCSTLKELKRIFYAHFFSRPKNLNVEQSWSKLFHFWFFPTIPMTHQISPQKPILLPTPTVYSNISPQHISTGEICRSILQEFCVSPLDLRSLR